MKEDFNRLRLKHHGDPAMMEKILQKECRWKTSAKLPRTLLCDGFTFPSLAVAEMATSDAVADIHASLIPEGGRVLDMTCGLGIDAFAFARKSSEVITLEIDHHTAETARRNVRALGLENVEVLEGDSVEWLRNNDEKFDTIFIDPARRGSAGRHYRFADCRPDIIPVLPLMVERCGTLIIKGSPMMDISGAVAELGRECRVTVIGTVRECKEVVYIIKGGVGERSNEGRISRVTAVTVGEAGFSFTPDEERDAPVSYTLPSVGEYLIEPFPAVMKSGGMRSLSTRFGVGKLNPNTNLFASGEIMKDFPGEFFSIEEIYPFDKRGVRELSRKYPKINVSVRNFPLTAPQFVSKLKIKEGGDRMVFGTTDSDNRRLMIVTEMGVR